MQVERKTEAITYGQENEGFSPLENLAEEIDVLITSFLSFSDLLNMRLVSFRWNRISTLVLEECSFGHISLLMRRYLQSSDSQEAVPAFVRQARRLKLNLKALRFSTTRAPWLFDYEDHMRKKTPKISSLQFDQKTKIDDLEVDKMLELCKGLQCLHIDDTIEKENPILKSLVKCPSLERVILSGSITYESIWELFLKVPALCVLDLSNCYIKGSFSKSEVPEAITFGYLETFNPPKYIDKNFLEFIFQKAKHLTELSFCSFDRELSLKLEELQGLIEEHYQKDIQQTLLSSLTLDYTNDEKRIEVLGKCTGLKELKIYVKGIHSFHVDSLFCQSISRLPRLEKISFSFEEIQERDFCHLIERFKEKFYSCEIRKMLFDNTLNGHSVTCSSLVRIVLFENCNSMTFSKILRIFPNLKELDASRTGGFVFDPMSFHLREQFPNLKTLRLGSPYNLSATTIYNSLLWKISSVFPNVEGIDLRHCDAVPYSIFDIPVQTHNNSIRELYITHPQLDESQLEKVKKGFKRLILMR